jgi:hypothetical protein
MEYGDVAEGFHDFRLDIGRDCVVQYIEKHKEKGDNNQHQLSLNKRKRDSWKTVLKGKCGLPLYHGVSRGEGGFSSNAVDGGLEGGESPVFPTTLSERTGQWMNWLDQRRFPGA